jgi:SAM-dependent methyltransferase
MNPITTAPEVDVSELRDAIQAMYRSVAREPHGDFHFETGRPLAERLGYPADLLDAVPVGALASFAGVGHPLGVAGLQRGERVLDLGSGSGTDAFAAGRLVGPAGAVLGVDMTDAQLAKARTLRDRAGMHHVGFVHGLVEEPPVGPAGSTR